MLAIGESPAIAAGAASDVVVNLARSGVVRGFSVSSPTATDRELQVTAVSIGGKPLLNNSGNAAMPWAGLQNAQGSPWYVLTQPVPTGNSGAVVVNVVNGNAAAADLCVAVEYD